MPIAVTNSTSTIILDDGGGQIAVSKELVRVSNYDTNVRIQWSPTEYRVYPAADFTAPTGTALAIKDAIEAFLDTSTPSVSTAVTSVIPGTGATNLGKAIDTATGLTDTGVLTLATRDDALSALTPIEGDNVQLRVDANGALWTHDDALDAALAGNELQVDIVAALPAGELFLGAMAGRTIIANGTVTRPADTTTYTANDVISAATGVAITFSVARLTSGSTGRSGVIQSATLVDSGNETTKLDGDLFLFDTSFTAGNDNAAFVPTDANMLNLLGVITFSGGTARSGLAGTGGNSAYPNALSGGIPFVCLTENQLYGIFVARNAYVPISAEVFTFRLGILQD